MGLHLGYFATKSFVQVLYMHHITMEDAIWERDIWEVRSGEWFGHFLFERSLCSTNFPFSKGKFFALLILVSSLPVCRPIICTAIIVVGGYPCLWLETVTSTLLVKSQTTHTKQPINIAPKLRLWSQSTMFRSSSVCKLLQRPNS